MPLKVDYVNQIPSTATKIYDILDSADNPLFEEVKIIDETVYTEEGDSFGATDINATNTQVNANTQSISDIGTILGDVTVEQLALLADVTGDIATTAFVQQELDVHKADYESLLNDLEVTTVTELQNGWEGTITFSKNKLGQVYVGAALTAGVVTDGTIITPPLTGHIPISNTIGITGYNGGSTSSARRILQGLTLFNTVGFAVYGTNAVTGDANIRFGFMYQAVK